MTLEATLQDLAERRLAFKAYREQVEEEARKFRADRLATEQSSIDHLVARAAAEGATLGQIKRAYGTKDHRTVANIVQAKRAEIEALREAKADEQLRSDWFAIEDNGVTVKVGEHEALFTYTYVDDEVMFVTEEPLWNGDFTVRNEAVALLDGKTADDSEEARAIAAALELD